MFKCTIQTEIAPVSLINSMFSGLDVWSKIVAQNSFDSRREQGKPGKTSLVYDAPNTQTFQSIINGKMQNLIIIIFQKQTLNKYGDVYLQEEVIDKYGLGHLKEVLKKNHRILI